MSWIEVLDGVLWGVALAVSVFLVRCVYRRRDLPVRLFLGMVAALLVLQMCQLGGFVARLLLWLSPGPGSEAFAGFVQMLWPVDNAALVIFGALTLHFFLVFPTKSRVILAWRWSPLLFYLPASFLTIMILSRLVLSPDSYRTLWTLERTGLGDNSLQFLFVILVLLLALARLCLSYVSRTAPLVRQQSAWILWGIGVGGGLAILTDYLPRVTGLPRLATFVPGLDQLPTLIILGSVTLSMVRHHTFDLTLVVNRSVVYSLLMVSATILYLALMVALRGLYQYVAPDTTPALVTILTTLVLVLVALPLHDAIQRLVDRLFLRGVADYPRLLQEFSRVLTRLVAMPRLLTIIAEQIDDVLHPAGLAVVLAEGQDEYCVVLSRDPLAAHPLWQKGHCLDRQHPIPKRLAASNKALYVPRSLDDLSLQPKDTWQQLEASGACVFVPMHLRDSLVGWLVLGPKRSELPYTRRDLEFLSALADQSSVALENARLYSAIQRRATELSMLAMVASATSSTLDLERVLDTIVESVVQVMSCDKSAIFELNEDGSELSLRMSRGLSEEYIQAMTPMRVGEDEQTGVFTTRKQLVVPDVLADSRFLGLATLAEKEGYVGFVDTPLVGREGVLGVLTVFFAQAYTPSPGDLEVLSTFASQASIAIENARLYASVTRERDRAEELYQRTDAALARRLQELTTIEEISRQLADMLDLDGVMNSVLERALQATKADRGVISLYEAEEHNVRLLAREGFPPGLERFQTEPWPDTWGITGRVARTGSPALVPDVSQDPDYVIGASTSRSQLSVPISYEGQVLGVITLESDQLGAFVAEHVRFVELLADHAAIGMNNAQLFQQVMEGRDLLEAILNSTNDAVIMLNRAGEATLINPQVREMFGQDASRWLRSANLLDAAQVLKSSVLRYSDLDLGRLAEQILRIREHPDQVVETNFGFELANQHRFFEATTSPVFNTGGEVIGHVAVIRDVTRRQEVEQFREDLTSMVIHNLQGPLAALITSLETLWADGLDNAEMAKELLRIALSSAQKLYGRVDSVLWIRRLEDKKMPINLHAAPLPGVIEMVVDEYRPMAATVGVCLETSFAPDLRPVMIDEEMIGRVFSNLLDNALKYTPIGGQILVRAAPASDGAQPLVQCAVSDTGCGIPPYLRDLIFDKFRRGEAVPRGRRKGMGIGLYFCKLAVEGHGGRIWVESDKAQGTTFYFTLPVAVYDL